MILDKASGNWQPRFKAQRFRRLEALGFRTVERGDDGEEHVETTKRRLEQWWEISWRLWKREGRAGPDVQAQAGQPIFSTQVDLPHTVDPSEAPTEQELG